MPGLLLSLSTPNLPAASATAVATDTLYAFVYWVSVVCFVGIVAAIIYFAIKYRRRTANDATPMIKGHTPTEVAFASGLFILVMVMFIWGWLDYQKMRLSPSNAYEINVVGQQWSWTFQYANGKKTLNELYVPVNTPIKLIMTSADVLHGFYVPALRIKRDVVPGSYNYLAFTATLPGIYDIFCSQFCGTAHSSMLAKLHVVDANTFADWLDNLDKYASNAPTTRKTLVEIGTTLYSTKTCSACHSTDGQTRVGPSFKGIFGKTVQLKDGRAITVDESYLRESMMEPNKDIVQGFTMGAMPTFKGQLSDDEVNALIAFIKSLK